MAVGARARSVSGPDAPAFAWTSFGISREDSLHEGGRDFPSGWLGCLVCRQHAVRLGSWNNASMPALGPTVQGGRGLGRFWRQSPKGRARRDLLYSDSRFARNARFRLADGGGRPRRMGLARLALAAATPHGRRPEMFREGDRQFHRRDRFRSHRQAAGGGRRCRLSRENISAGTRTQARNTAGGHVFVCVARSGRVRFTRFGIDHVRRAWWKRAGGSGTSGRVLALRG